MSTTLEASIRMRRRIGLVALLVAGAMACGGSVAAERTEAVSSGGRTSSSVGGAAGAGTAGATVTSQPPSVILTPEQRDALAHSACGEVVFDAIDVPLVVTFLIDASASMLDSAAASSGALRWDLAHDATSLALDRLRIGDKAGMALFPNQATTANLTGAPLGLDACVNLAAIGTPTAIGASMSDPRPVLRDVINGATPSGATPLFDAYRAATASLTGTNGLAYLVLVTDGRATMAEGCQGNGAEDAVVDTQSVIAAITENHSRGIGTIVAGTTRNEPAVTPSNEERDWLSNAATAGGAAIPSSCSPSGNPKYCHVDLTQGTSGVAELLSAVGSRPPCTMLQIDPTAPALTAIKHLYVVFDSPLGSSILYSRTDAHCPNGEGFYLDPVTDSATLCEASCSHVQSQPFGSVRLLWTCPIND